ncbi:hypothetical protein D3C80_1959900 [compost metagenome]
MVMVVCRTPLRAAQAVHDDHQRLWGLVQRDPEMHQTKKGNQYYFGSVTCKPHGFLFRQDRRNRLFHQPFPTQTSEAGNSLL